MSKLIDTFLEVLFSVLVLLQKGNLVTKISLTLGTSLLIALPIWVSDVVNNHIVTSPSFLSILVILLISDLFLGAWKHYKAHTFDFTELFKGLGIKVGVSILAMVLFNSLTSIHEMQSLGSIKDMITLTGKVANFVYIGGSAFNNMYYITNGKFPPVSWMERFKRFETTLDVKELLKK
jgi:hypothetical protein